MKKYEKILKVNLIVSAVVWNILIVVLCLDFGKKYLAIILGIEIIIELNFLIIYLTGRNLGEEKKVEYSSITKRHSVMKFFGNQPSADGGKDSFCNIQEDYNGFIKAVYEPLREKNPNYIKREIIGRDASNKYNIYAYTFEPRYFQQHILLVSGIHANEEDAVASLGRIMQIITEESSVDCDILYMRQNVKISVIPVANPWGFSQKPKKRNNVNGYTLQSFDKKKNISEVDYIKKYIDKIKNDLSFVVDMHTTTNDSYLDFYGVIHKNCPNVRTLFRVNSWLCEQYAKKKRNVDDQYFGYRTSSCTLNYYCYKVAGIPSSTLELSDYHWDSKKNTSKVITMGVTMWLNYIIQQVNDEYTNVGNDIPNDKYKKVKG